MKALDDLLAAGVAGRTVLVRSDLNVPLDGSHITDDGRIRASLPTLRALADGGARVLVAAHLGRPEGGPDDRHSLAPVATRLGELLGRSVRVVELSALGAGPLELADGEVALLQN
ncbi:MAG: phosphoglycerate kinase, partial [Actinomycetes bacterium]